jgi:hypothetical protein
VATAAGPPGEALSPWPNCLSITHLLKKVGAVGTPGTSNPLAAAANDGCALEIRDRSLQIGETCFQIWLPAAQIGQPI